MLILSLWEYWAVPLLLRFLSFNLWYSCANRPHLSFCFISRKILRLEMFMPVKTYLLVMLYQGFWFSCSVLCTVQLDTVLILFIIPMYLLYRFVSPSWGCLSQVLQRLLNFVALTWISAPTIYFRQIVRFLIYQPPHMGLLANISEINL